MIRIGAKPWHEPMNELQSIISKYTIIMQIINRESSRNCCIIIAILCVCVCVQKLHSTTPCRTQGSVHNSCSRQGNKLRKFIKSHTIDPLERE